jgi:hypothetical protein
MRLAVELKIVLPAIMVALALVSGWAAVRVAKHLSPPLHRALPPGFGEYSR